MGLSKLPGSYSCSKLEFKSLPTVFFTTLTWFFAFGFGSGWFCSGHTKKTCEEPEFWRLSYPVLLAV
jgi:hypothetical protein